MRVPPDESVGGRISPTWIVAIDPRCSTTRGGPRLGPLGGQDVPIAGRPRRGARARTFPQVTGHDGQEEAVGLAAVQVVDAVGLGQPADEPRAGTGGRAEPLV